MPATIPVSYHLPPLGLVEVIFHDQAAALYDRFKQIGEIARLKRLDQLGVIRNVIEGAHHSRWEYIFLTNLLTQLAYKRREFKLSAEVQLGDGRRVSSGLVLIQLWALLLNFGHLEWTFAAERALLALLKRDWRLRKHFLEGLTDPIQEYCEEVIDAERVYSFYHAIAFARLLRLKANLGLAADDVDLWIDALRLYCLPQEDDKIAQLRQWFKMFRRLAFVALDCYYVPTLVELDIAEVFVNPERLCVLLGSEGAVGRQLFGAVDSYLYRSLYLRPDVVEELFKSGQVVEDYIVAHRHDNIDKLLEDLCNGKFRDRLITTRAGYEPRHLVQIPLFSAPPLTRSVLETVRPLTLQRQLKRHFSGHIEAVELWPFVDMRQRVIDFFVQPDTSPAEVLRTLAAISGWLAEQIEQDIVRTGWDEPTFWHNVLYTGAVEAVLAAIFRNLFKQGINVESRYYFGPGPNSFCAFTKPVAKRFVRQRVGVEAASKSRRAELGCLEDAIRLEDPSLSYVVAPGPFFLVSDSGTELGEIDGMYLAIPKPTSPRQSPSLVIIEAKDQRTGAQAAIRNQLDTLSTRLRSGLRADIELRKEFGQNIDYGILEIRAA